MDGAKATKTHNAYRRPYDPANFITYAIAACVTFVGLILSFRLCLGFMGMAQFPILTVSVLIVLAVFVFGAVACFRQSGVPEKVMHCEKTILTFATFLPLLLIGLQDHRATSVDNIFGYVLFAVIACATIADVALNIVGAGEYKLISLALYVIIGWACVIRLDCIVALCGDFCFWMCIGGFAVYLVGTVVGSISAIKCRRLINSFAVVIGTALNFVGIFLYVL